jgi:membrane glycosyltransferase
VLGLTDAARIAVLRAEIATAAEAVHTAEAPELRRDDDEEGDARRAVALAQSRYAAFLETVFGDPAKLEPLWLRAFIAAHPDVFLADVSAARASAARFGDAERGAAPVHAQFRDQAFSRLNISRRAAFAVAAVVLAAWVGSGDRVFWAWLVLGVLLFTLSATGMLVALRGFFEGFRKQPVQAAGSTDAPLPRTALVMPIYEEDAEHVFAALGAMREALAEHPQGASFDLFVLSDTRSPERAAEEERALRRVVGSTDLPISVYYRRRVKNERQKAGNLAEFFERFGPLYTYAVVLDADSLMRADTLVALVERMEANPRCALMQAPLALHGGTTLFARSQQYVASVVGPLFTRGLAAWAGRHGNYYGHNAVVRVQAFLECCALPELAGEPPLGGHILSHDFVEAALLCRAGWEVRIAHDLSGSWEELPQTLPDYVARDRRWCQGNMQHIRIACAAGLKPMSRAHMAIGVASYLAGPAWLLFVALGLAVSLGRPDAALPVEVALGLCALTASVLLLPRVLGVLEVLFDRDRTRAHGGALGLIASALVEAVLAACLAPLFMLHHARCVVSIAMGNAVRWATQQRRASSAFSRIVMSERSAMASGIVAGAVLALLAPQLLWWLAPVWLPLSLAIPLAALASSDRAGAVFERVGLLRTPEETEPDSLIGRLRDFRALTRSDEAARFRDLALDPILLAAHVARLERAELEAPSALEAQRIARLTERALRVGPAALTSAERQLLMSSATSMRELHREAWRRWPVESWQMSRIDPQLPHVHIGTTQDLFASAERALTG